MAPTDRQSYESALLTVRFLGPQMMRGGVSIYDLSTTLLALQRIVNKAHLANEGRLRKGAFPRKQDRTEISLTIGERRRTSDAFSLIPRLTDPDTYQHLNLLIDWVGRAFLAYWLGRAVQDIAEEPDSSKQLFIASVYPDVANIVHRIDAAGEISKIEIGNPRQAQPLLADFSEESKPYIDGLDKEIAYGPVQTIRGAVYRLYPNSHIVSIRRQGEGKVNVSLRPADFESLRYDRGAELDVTFIGRPRYKLGVEAPTITDFEASAIEIHSDLG